ncbi:Hypothetical protein BN117_1640 [Bordetella parapertussis Bpp5]|uniref:Large polyvalent protein associated domain-containing protein n=1 Tax=Bordetella parapertussis (strain Bpp5) TaxID=1208660 RepID=K0M8S1_BORPB|nr:Hypothetical protein BN117_1640 [Bordetella parapertussis Bpp5]
MLRPDQGQAARAGFVLASDTDPDAYAEAQRVARRANLPIETVLNQPKEAKRQDTIGAIDFDTLGKTSPATAALLADVEKAKIAHDNVDNMTGIESVLSSLGTAVKYLVSAPDQKNTLMGDIGAGFAQANRGAAGLFQSVFELPNNLVGTILPANPLQPVADQFAQWGAQSKDLAKRLSPPQSDTLGSGVSSGVQSLTSNLLMLPLALLPGGQPAALGGMASMTGGQFYQDARSQGLTPAQALPFAVSQATIEYATEKLPVSRLIGDLHAGSPLLKTLAHQVATEVPGEQVATVLQDLNEWAVLPENEDKPFSAYLAERPSAAAQTLIATLVGVGGNVAVMRGIDRTITTADQRTQRAQAAQQQAELLARLNQLAAADKVLARDPDTFEQFVANAAENGPLQQVFIDANTLMQSGLAEQVAAVSPAVAAQLPEALQTGGQVAIPVEEYAARIAPTEAAQGLLDHLKTEPEGFSRAEAQQYMQSQAEELRAEVERALGKQQGDDAFKQSAEAVRAAVKTQLDTAARFMPQVNDAYSSMVGNFYAVQAARLGTTPEALFQQYPLRVAAENVAGGQQFDQEHGPFGPVLRDFQGDARGAIAKLLEMKSGEAIGALHHPDIGDIDLVWGEEGTRRSDGYGLAKLAKWHPEVLDDLQGILSTMKVTSRTENRVNLESADHRAGVRLTWDDQAKHWLLTAFQKKGGVAGTRTGTTDLFVEDGTARPDDASDAIVDQKIDKFYQGGGRARGAFDPATLTVSLLKNADLSTFLHESGHFFLEVQFDIAARLADKQRAGATLTDAEAEVQRDAQTLLDWFGVRDLAAWNDLDFEAKRAHHEQFARGFEAYLFEGKAPSIEMHGLFQRFRAWLLNVYRDLKALNVELTPEVRNVFDRMLATGEQIALAEQGRSMMPLFATAEQAGMTPEEFAAYQALGVDATNDAIQDLQARGLRDMRWLHNARGRIIKQLQKDAEAQRAQVRMDVRREVMSQPIYRAWQFLTGKLAADDKIAPPAKRTSSPDSIDETQDSLFAAIAKLGGLNRAAVQSEWGIDPKERIPMPAFGKHVLRREGGLSIDAMGEALGQYGYLTLDEHGKYDLRQLEDKFFEELRGNTQYSIAYDYAADMETRAGDQVVNSQALGAGRFDMGELRAMGLPTEVINAVQARRMTAGNGLHPDIVAEMFGFTSGDELVRKLAQVETPSAEIEALTDVRMLEQFGDLASPEAIEKAADKAIHNDARARFVATEANALAKATGQRKVLASAAREFARAMIARLKVRDIKPGQYANAEVRAAKAAEKASKSGDLATAAAEKRNQLIQNYATRAAYDAQENVDRGLRYLKKFEGDIKGLDADYADQIGNLLERFDLRKGQSNKAVDKRTALAEWIKAQREAGLEPDIPPELENEAFRTSYKNLTVEEFQGLVDTVRQIEHLGRLKHKLLTAADQRAYEAVRDEIAGSIRENAQGRQADTRTPTTNMGRALQGLKRFWASHIKAATWARVMDGGKDGGPVWEYFVRSANERGDQETTMRAEATAKLSEILAPVFKLGRMGGKGQFFPSINRSLNREARLTIALNMGNEGNIQRLLGGEGWTPAQIAPVLQSLTAQEWQAVQAVWDHFEGYRPQIAAKERRVYGKEPAWVEPRPLTITTADGQTLTLRGGYYPIKYDPAASQRAEEHSDAESARRQLQGAYTTATTRRSFTKSRVEEVSGRPLLYTLSGLYSGVNDVIHDLAWHEWLIDANRLLRSQTIDGAIREHYGPEAKQQFKTWAADIAEGDKGAANAGEAALGRLRQGVSASGLGFNVMSAAIQITGFNQSIVRVGAPWIGRGIAKYLGNPLGLTRTVHEMSDFMANRARTRFRELNELRNQVQDQSAFNEFIGRYAYFMMMRMQQVVDVPTWWGAYEKAIAAGNEESRAVALADQAVIDAQGGGQTKDLSAIERGGPALRLFTVFYSFMNTALNLGVAQTMGANTPAKRAKLAVDYLMLYTVPAVLGYTLKAALTPGDSGDDDLEEIAKKLAAEQLGYLMGLMVVVREFNEVAKMVTGNPSFGYSGPAGLRGITDVQKFGQQAMQGEFDDAFRKSAVNLIGDFTGLPAAQINRTITGTQALAEGKTENPAAVAFGFQEKR